MLDVSVGSKVGKWEVIGEAFTQPDSKIRRIPVRCECGNAVNVRRDHLRRGTSLQCIRCRRAAQAKALTVDGSGWNTLYYRYRTNAKNRNLEFHLTKEEVVKLCSQNCYYCGESPSDRTMSPSQMVVANGIDRIDSERHYHLDNCVPCCAVCNKMKMELDQDFFLEKIDMISKRHGLR
jgi:hypothetical protein